MPVEAVLLVRLREAPDAGHLDSWRQEVLSAFDADEFYPDGPLWIVAEARDGPMLVDGGSVWVDVRIAKAYYGRGYERGDAEYFVRLAACLERLIPGCEVWYGNDSSDETIKPFGAGEREAFLAYFREAGHEPYNSKLKRPAAHAPPSPADGLRHLRAPYTSERLTEMSPRKHLGLLLQATSVWGVFWLAGLPAYYQQCSTVMLALGSILLSVAISLAAILVLRRGREATRMSRAFWLSFYYTVPFAVLDALYCGWYLGHGVQFLARYWYLSIFYVTPWLTFIPTAVLLGHSTEKANTLDT